MRTICPINSTNVRLSMLTALLGLLSACTTTLPQINVSRHCLATQILMCEDFGPEHKCVCADAGTLSRSLTAFGHPTGSSPAVW